MVFARLAHLTDSTISGLDAFGMLSNEDREDLERLSGLSSSLSTIAEKELRGELPTDEEFDLIRYIGEDLYDFWDKISAEEAERLGKDWFSLMDFPAALTVGIATNSDTGEVLHVGTGGTNTIYVLVPVDGSLRIAKGSVFSYYQFTDRERLTDSEWRIRLGMDYAHYDDPSFKSVGPDDKPDWTLSYRMENE